MMKDLFFEILSLSKMEERIDSQGEMIWWRVMYKQPLDNLDTDIFIL